uniref:FERM domain-containing protein n=1 Tax=Romanomermis culicivorax TaxID=13658 RepID=A0A915HLZ9_ROMCU
MKFGGSKSSDHGADDSTQGQNIIAVAESEQLVVPTGLKIGWKILTVYLLTKKHLYVALQLKCKIGEILDYVCQYLDLQQPKIFGLAIHVNGEYRFLDCNERIGDKSCVLHKSLSKSSGTICDRRNVTSSVILHLRVHTYIDCVGYIKCHKSLHYYYLQLRENMKTQWDQSLIVEERCFEAAAFALQADFGDFRNDLPSYFDPLDYFPAWVVETHGKDYLVRHMPVMHSDLKGFTKEDCMVKFCREVNSNGQRYHIYTFIWSKIAKVAFDVRKFFVCGLDDKKLVFYTTSSEKSRYLLTICRSIHQNLMNLRDDLVEANKADIKENHQFRESYIYSDIRDFEWVQNRCSDGNLELQNCKNGPMLAGQRISLVSGASSNTTSGIVSDRQQNHDSENDNEDEMDLELTDVAGQCCSSAAETGNNAATTKVFLDPQTKNNKKRSSTMIRVDNTEEADESGTHLVVVRTLAPTKDGTVILDQIIDNDFVLSVTNLSTVNVESVTASDRTLQAFSEDGHSVCTTCTIDKLDDSVDNDSPSYGINSRKVSTAFSEPLKIISQENLGQSSTTLNSKVSVDNLSSNTAAIRYSANAGNNVLPRSKFTVAELRQKTLDVFTGKFAPIAVTPTTTNTRIASGEPSMVVDSNRPYQKSSSMKTLSNVAQTQTSLSYLSFYKSTCKVPAVTIDSSSNSCYNIVESQTVCGKSMMQASLETDIAQLDSPAYQFAERLPTIALRQDFAPVNSKQICNVDRSDNSKRWPTICGINQKYLSHQDMQFFEQNNLTMSQAKSEPRLTAWQLSIQDRECIPVCCCDRDTCYSIHNKGNGKSIANFPYPINPLKSKIFVD